MREFTDAKGDHWTVDVTAGTLRRVQQLLKDQYGNVDLGEPLEGKPPLLTRFDVEIAFKVDLLYAVLKPQLDERGVSDLEFAERLSGDALFHASEAFMEAWADFFRSLRRPYLTAAIEKERQQAAKIWAKGKELVRSEALQRKLDGDLEELGSSVLSSLRSPGATRSPEPSAS